MALALSIVLCISGTATAGQAPRVAPPAGAATAAPAGTPRVPEAGELSSLGEGRRARASENATGFRSDMRDVDLIAEGPGGEVSSVGSLERERRLSQLASLTSGRGVAGAPTRTRTSHREAPWATPRLLADATHMNDEYVSLQVSPLSGDLFAVFQAYDLGGTDRDIHIARSSDDGATWSVVEMPSFSQDEYHPELAIDAAGYLYVAWIRDDGVIIRTRSADPDDETAWEYIKGLTTGETNATPTIAVSGTGDFSTVFIAAGWLTVNWDLYVYEWTLIWMYSTNGGNTVTYDYFVPDGYQDYWPDAELNGGTCYLVNAEADYSTGELEVLLAADAVSGGFTDPVYCSAWTDMDCGFPTLAAEGANVYTVFQLDYDDGLGNIDGDIVYCYSDDGCATVYGPYDMIADEYESVGPVVYAAGGIVGCLWLDAPPNGDEFRLAARQAGAYGHPDAWGGIEYVTDTPYVEPTFRSDAGAVAEGMLHAAWVDRRDFPTQGLNIYTSERAVLPNLAPFTPAAWDAPLVASMVRGDRENGVLAAGDSVFVSISLWNDGLASTGRDLDFHLLVDGAPEAVWVVPGGLDAGWYTVVEDHAIVEEAGPHVLSFEIDPADSVAESNETDNVFADTLEFIDGEPVLRLSPGAIEHTCELRRLSRSEAEVLGRTAPLRRTVSVPVVGARLAGALAGGRADLRVVVEAAERLDAERFAATLGGADREVRRAAVRAGLERAQALFVDELSPLLGDLESRGAVRDVNELWLRGALAMTADAQAVSELADHPAVGRIWLDDRLSSPLAGSWADDARANAWHIAKVAADLAWGQGLDGEGVVIGHLDSGVAYDHPDLAGGMWNGGVTYPHHGYDCLDEDDDPYDGDTEFWHGTHTAGLIIGDGTGGTATGVAPGASLMALRCVPGYQSDMTEALQFALDNGADLVTMSAGWGDPADALREANRVNAEVLEAAGLLWTCAAGNGDNTGGHYVVPNDISSPGDCPTPWYGDAGTSAVVAVGATDASDGVWSSSSVGPTEWDITSTPGFDDYPYPPGLMKPDVAAPGDNVTSTVPGGYVAYSGTSMATPIVAGACAILLQSSPSATPACIAEAIETGAVDVADPGRDNTSGAGRLDVTAALASLPSTDAATFRVVNDGVVPLIVNDVVWKEGWLSVSPAGCAVDPADSSRFTVIFDAEGLSEGVYFDRVLLASNAPGSPHALPVMLVVGGATGVHGSEAPAPFDGRLAASPNPFNPRTEIAFSLARRSQVGLAVFDVSGRLVRRLLDRELPAGMHRVVWDGRDDGGAPAASGVYFLMLESEEGRAVRKVALVK
jgi:subtilisin family serine protease